MKVLPDPSPLPDHRPRRRRTAIVVCAAAVFALAVGSIILTATRDDGASSIEVGAAFDGAPITPADADVDVYIDDDTLDADLTSVRSFLESNPDVTAYTYVTTDQAMAEREVLEGCATGVVGSLGAPEFRLRVDDAAPLGQLAEQLASMRAVTRVQVNPTPAPASAVTTLPPTTLATSTTPAPTTAGSGDGSTSTNVAVVTTTTASTGTPTATEPPSGTTPTDASSKEIPFALPAAAHCPPADSTPPPTTVVDHPPAAPAATLPPAGEQPADVDAARAAVNDMFVLTHTGTAPPVEQRLEGNVEDYEELLPLIQEAYASHQHDVDTQTVKIYDIRFVSPTRAAVQFQNFIAGPDVVQVQYAVLIDGRWKIARESECAALARANVHCPEGP